MNIDYFLAVLRARWYVVVLVFLITVATTLIISLLLPKTYTASALVLLDTRGNDLLRGGVSTTALMPTQGYVLTQVDIMNSGIVAQMAAKKLGVDTNSSAQQLYLAERKSPDQSIIEFYAEEFSKKLRIIPSRESRAITVEYSSPIPQMAAAVANAFAYSYIDTLLEIQTEQTRDAITRFEQQAERLRGDLEVAQRRVSEYQQETGIASAEERLDVENARLADLSTQLVAMQNATFDAQARYAQVQAVRDGRAPADTLPEVINHNLIQITKVDLTRAETQFSEIKARYGENHPDYHRVSADVETLRQQLNDQIETVLSSIEKMYTISLDRERELANTLEAQRSKIIETRGVRGPIEVYVQQVLNLQQGYDAAMSRLSEERIQLGLQQINERVLTPAQVPLEHSSPKILLNTLLAAFVGTILGLGFALLLEFIDTRVRSKRDLEDLLDIPVLGDLSKSKHKSKSRVPFFRHLGWGRKSV